jgi:hypothetical protein
MCYETCVQIGFAATSKRVVESFVQSFCDSYEPVLRNTNGNGEVNATACLFPAGSCD